MFQNLRELQPVHVLAATADAGARCSRSRGARISCITAISKAVLHPAAAHLLHTSVSQADIALLGVHIVQPTGASSGRGPVGAHVYERSLIRNAPLKSGSWRVSVVTHVMIAIEEHLRERILGDNGNPPTSAFQW